MNPGRFSHFAWPVSPYCGKSRAYLDWKGAPYDEVVVTAYQLYFTVRRAVGRMVMPTIRTPAGEWLQDTSLIIDTLEASGQLPGPSITPPGKVQRLADRLLELHGDEWVAVAALHKRWNDPENDRFARREFGRCAFPWLPAAIATPLAAPFANRMAGFLPKLGIDDATAPGVDTYVDGLIANLEHHLGATGLPYLLGHRPGLGDFALYGPMWAHLYRDPATTSLFDDAPAVRAWLERLTSPSEADRSPTTAFLPGDEVPETLDPLFRTVFDEQMVFTDALVDAMNAWTEAPANAAATRLPRSLGDSPFVVGGRPGTRKLVTFTGWMLQRPLDAYAADPQACDPWLDRVGGASLAAMRLHRRQEMTEFKLRLVPQAPTSP